MKIHRLTILFFFLFLVAFLLGNIGLPITDPVESAYALTAKEMVQSGNWLAPQIYHQVWFDKPIFIYWLIALSYKVMGLSDFAARFPSALLGAASVAFLYQEIRSMSGRRILSIWTALICGTSLEFWVIAHGIVTDMALFFATVGTITCAYRGIVMGKRGHMVLAYVFAAIGVLTKGPVALVLPGLIYLLFALIERKWLYVKRLFPWQGILVFFLVAAPWYVFMYAYYGQDFLNGFFGLNNVVRATQSEHPSDNYWWYYFALFLGASLPWTGAVLYGMYKGWKHYRHCPYFRFSMIFGWGTILFYSLMATKYPTYTFISLIPFSFLGALGVVKLTRRAVPGRYLWYIVLPTLLLWGAYTVASFFVPWGFWYLLYVLAGISTLLLIGALVKGNHLAIPVIVTVATVLISGVVLYEGVRPFLVERSTISYASQVGRFQGYIYYYNRFKPSLVYYSGRDIWRIDAGIVKPEEGRSAAWEKKYTMPQESEAQVAGRIQQGQPVMIIADTDDLAYLEKTPFYGRLVRVATETGETIFVTK